MFFYQHIAVCMKWEWDAALFATYSCPLVFILSPHSYTQCATLTFQQYAYERMRWMYVKKTGYSSKWLIVKYDIIQNYRRFVVDSIAHTYNALKYEYKSRVKRHLHKSDMLQFLRLRAYIIFKNILCVVTIFSALAQWIKGLLNQKS